MAKYDVYAVIPVGVMTTVDVPDDATEEQIEDAARANIMSYQRLFDIVSDDVDSVEEIQITYTDEHREEEDA